MTTMNACRRQQSGRMPSPPTISPITATSARGTKRDLDTLDTPTNSAGQSPAPDSKRRRIRDSNSALPLTPPPTTPVRLAPLTVVIPQKTPTRAEERILKLRIGHAQRRKPKLQRPFPDAHEIEKSYQYKLMRQYPDPLAVPSPNFIKPPIQRSARVDNLRKHFPFPDGAGAGAAPPSKRKQRSQQLLRNQAITQSEAAQRSAWENFAFREIDRVDRGREAMLESGLLSTDLALEHYGCSNGLPEWKKECTVKYASEFEAVHVLHPDELGYEL